MRRLFLIGAFLALAVPSSSAAHLPIVAPQDWWPVWSPNGQDIAFTRVEQRTMTLEVVRFPSSTLARTYRIASNQGQLNPSWSSDGKLAFSLGGRIYTSNADGSGRMQVTSQGKAYAPAWRPHSTDIAYLTTVGARNTDLWVAGKLWARDAYGKPAWSPDGSELAFQRDDGIYVATGPGSVKKIAAAVNPQGPAWSPDGTQIAYVASKRLWIATADGSAPPRLLVSVGTAASDPSWTPDGVAVVYTSGGALWYMTIHEGSRPQRLAAATTAGASVSSENGAIAFTGPLPGCGYSAIRLDAAGRVSTASGACEIDGTPHNDVIEARDGHRETIFCGPGRDTVYADRSDVLRGCEIVHRS